MNLQEKIIPIENSNGNTEDKALEALPKQRKGDQITDLPNMNTMSFGNGSKSIHMSSEGLWIGADRFADAPFKIDISGNLTNTIVTNLNYKLSGVTGIDKAASLTGIETLTNKTINGATMDIPRIDNALLNSSAAYLTATSEELNKLDRTYAPTYWVPELYDVTKGNGNSAGSYFNLGNIFFGTFWYEFGSSTVMGAGYEHGITNYPIEKSLDRNEDYCIHGFVSFHDASGGTYEGFIYDRAIYIWNNVNGTWNILGGINDNAPFVWTTGDTIRGSFWFFTIEA